jgi:predicted amidohydrolase
VSAGRVTVAIVQAEVAPDLAAALGAHRAGRARGTRRGRLARRLPGDVDPGYPAWLDLCRDAALWDHAPTKAVFARMARDSVAVPGPTLDALGAMARASEITLVVGVTERVDGGPGRGTLYNSLLTLGPDGRLLNHHRKLVPTYTERLVWGTGDAEGLRAWTRRRGASGGLVCWEHWMPLARQAMHESGEDVHVAVWPTAHEMHQVASRQYAFEGRCFVLAAGSLLRASALPPELEPHPERVTSPDQWVLRGGSAIVGPDGRYVVEPVYDEPRVLVAELDLGPHPRGEHDARRDRALPPAGALRVPPRPPRPPPRRRGVGPRGVAIAGAPGAALGRRPARRATTMSRGAPCRCSTSRRPPPRATARS